MVSVAFKNRTRDEVIAAFRESIRRKHEWQERAEESIRKIKEERLQLSIWAHEPTWLKEILAEFDETISILTNKPQ